jgi:uncharacterized protein
MRRRRDGSRFGDKVQERTKTFLRKQLWVVLSTPLENLGAMAPLINAHLEYVLDLERRGVIFGAGPFLDESRRLSGEGMFIIRASSRAAASRIARADPFHKARVRRFALKEWQCNVGRQSVALRLSDQTCEIG